ncbi:MAG TPA: PIN domain-containing protein, partial [Acidimicrobiales bacterium]|nr:PIN domain-containing protein [Acidimicrobiales bacterium]
RDRESALTKLLLDTTFLIDADRGGSALDASIGDDDDVAIAAITIAELLVGVELADSRHRARRQRFVDDVSDVIRVIDYDKTVAAAHARLLAATRRQGRPRGAHDLVIAATALATGREVVSADASAFADLPGVLARSHRPNRS